MKRRLIRIGAFILVFFIEIYRKIKPEPKRIYFCYNQSIHQIYHSLFIAIELSNIQKDYQVVVLSTSKEASEIIEGELNSIPNNVKFIKIKHPGYNRINFSINWFVFLCRLRMYKPCAVVVTDYYDNVFRQLLLDTVWIYTFHGPENRGYSHPHIRDYELVIFPSEDELRKIENIIGPLKNYKVLGYSKFDYFHYHLPNPPQLFQEKRPVILYNPHFEEKESSFFDQGLDLLKALSDTNKYNIIFMPHPDLARKYPKLVNKALEFPNVVLVNRPKINLEYMALADLYITDVSSSAFEFLYFNKPIIYFNTKGRPKEAYPAWRFGKVVEDLDSLLLEVEVSLKNPQELEPQRREVFEKTFYKIDKGVSLEIAKVIWRRLRNIENRAQFFFSGSFADKRGGYTWGSFLYAKQISKELNLYFICRDISLSEFPRASGFKKVNIYPLKRILTHTPLRWGYKTMIFLELELFDRFASFYVDRGFFSIYANQGQALHIFKKAEKLGIKKILLTHTPHIDLVWDIHQEEAKILRYNYEWLGLSLRNKILREYELADLIMVSSRFSYQSFLERGFDERRLKIISFEIDKDYFRRKGRKKDKIFRILYVGRLTPEKGIHYLIEAFKQLNLSDSELLLFGGIATKKAKMWLKRLIGESQNIKISQGDSRIAYEQSSVLVHPALQDSFGLTIPEALAYGLPVIVTENTGAKELIKNGENGFIIPIRDVEAIKEKILYYYSKLEFKDG